jgi:hypothetical protein
MLSISIPVGLKIALLTVPPLEQVMHKRSCESRELGV